MDIKLKKLFTLLFMGLAATGLSAQPVPFEYKEAKILLCGGGTITVDVLESDEANNFELILPLEGAAIRDKKDKEDVPVEELRPGTKVSVVGQTVNYKRQVQKITLQSKWTGNNVEVDGLLEHFDPETGIAIIDGQKVKLKEGGTISGDKGGKCKKDCGCEAKSLLSVKSFGDLNMGRFVTAKGYRGDDGIIVVGSAEYCPNAMSKNDVELTAELAEELSDAAVVKGGELKGILQYRGYLQIGQAQFKLLDNLEVQGYVGYVANKLIPEYLNSIPPDAPEYVNFRTYVVQNPTPNLFALPNGIIVVHDGLLSMLENEAQLAAALSHEIAHVTHEHHADRFSKIPWNDIAKKVVLEIIAHKMRTNPPKWMVTLSMDVLKAMSELPPQTLEALVGVLSSNRGNLSNDFESKGMLDNSDHENQADRVGLFYMRQAGYDPREAANLRRQFMDKSGNGDFMQNLDKTTREMLVAVDRFPYQNPLVSIGDFLLAKSVEQLIDNLYSNHGKAKARFRSLNQLIAVEYGSDSFEGLLVDKEEYQESVLRHLGRP